MVAGDHDGADEELGQWAEVVHFPEEQPRGLCRDLHHGEWVKRFIRGQIWGWRPHLIWCWSPTDMRMCVETGIPTMTRIRALYGYQPEQLPDGVMVYRVSEECPGDWPVIHPGVEVTPPPREEDRQPGHVVRIGRADPDRHPKVFADALCHLRDEIESGEIVVSVIGEAFYGHWDWKAELQERDLLDNVFLWGQLPHDRAMRLLDTAAVHVANPPESFGQATAEAMMRGVIPVVADTGFGPAMVGPHGETAPNEPHALSEAIRRALVRSEDGLERERTRTHAIHRWNSERSARENVELIREATTFPRVDIVIPVHNHRQMTQDCIESLLGSTRYSNYRLIVVNDASEDDTAAYLWRLAHYMQPGRLTILNAEHRNGIKATMEGVEASDAPYVAILNNDMLLPPAWLTHLLSDLARHEDVGVMLPTLNDEEARLHEETILLDRGHRSVGLWRREAIQPPDERLVELQAGADNSMIEAMKEAGWRTALHTGVELYHVGSLCRQELPPEQLAEGCRLWWDSYDPEHGATVGVSAYDA